MPIADPVVGQVQHAADQGLVARDHLGLERRAVAAARRPLDHEAALGPDRHDDAVLDHLRLHQAEHLGAEVLAPVRPADAAARDLAAAQVHAFDARRVDEDLVRRQRQRHLRHRRRIDLERQIRLVRRAVAARAGSSWCAASPGQAHVAPQDAVLVEVGDRIQAGAERAPRARRAAAWRSPVSVGIELGLEQLASLARQRRIAGERLLHVGLAERDADLQQVLAVGAQHHDLAPVQPVQHQLVEAVALDLAAPHPGEGLLEGARGPARCRAPAPRSAARGSRAARSARPRAVTNS